MISVFYVLFGVGLVFGSGDMLAYAFDPAKAPRHRITMPILGLLEMLGGVLLIVRGLA